MKTYNKASTTFTNAFFISLITIFIGCFFKQIWLLLIAVIPVCVAIYYLKNCYIVLKTLDILEKEYLANKQDLAFVDNKTKKLSFYQKKMLYSLLLQKLSNKTCYSDDTKVIAHARGKYEMHSALKNKLVGNMEKDAWASLL